MKEIKAYIRETMADRVVDAVERIPEAPGVTVLHVRGYGHAADTGQTGQVRMVKLEIDVADDLLRTVVDAILQNARTGDGHPGDGKVFVSDIAEAYRIGDGATGEEALHG